MVSQGLDCRFASKEVYSFLSEEMRFKSPKVNCKIPNIFLTEKSLLQACIRGLIDTDGGLHRHHKKSSQIKFTNKSTTIIDSLQRALITLGYKPSRTVDHKEKKTHALYLFSKDVRKYFEEIGSNNPKNKIKFKIWNETGMIPLNIDIEDKVRLTNKIQEKMLGKTLNSIKIYGYGAKT